MLRICSLSFPVKIRPFSLMIFLFFRLLTCWRQAIISFSFLRLEGNVWWKDSWCFGWTEYRVWSFTSWWIMGRTINGYWQKIWFCLLWKLIIKTKSHSSYHCYFYKERQKSIKCIKRHFSIIKEIFLIRIGQNVLVYKSYAMKHVLQRQMNWKGLD